MPLTPDEAKTAASNFRAVVDEVIDSIAPDADGKVRITKAEATAILTKLGKAGIAFVVDLLD